MTHDHDRIATHVAAVFSPGDLVLDPVSGVETGRCYLGIERDVSEGSLLA